jgi:hypothetical protein
MNAGDAIGPGWNHDYFGGIERRFGLQNAVGFDVTTAYEKREEDVDRSREQTGRIECRVSKVERKENRSAFPQLPCSTRTHLFNILQYHIGMSIKCLDSSQ